MGDLLGDQQREEVAIGPRLPLGALHEVAPDAPRIGEVQPLEERIEIVIGGDHDRPPTRREGAAVLGRVQVLRCAPPLRAPSATWTRPARGSEVAAIVGGRSVGVERQAAAWRRAEIVRDVLGADRLLGEAALEGARAAPRRRASAAARAAARRRESRCAGADA